MEPTNASKPGLKTTEFWITVLTKVFIAVLTATGSIDSTVGAGLFGGAGSVYVASRSAKKMVEVKRS